MRTNPSSLGRVSSSHPDHPTAPATETPRSRGLVIGRIAGAPVIVTPSWALAAVVLTSFFAPTVTRFAPNLPGHQVAVVAFGFVLLLFGSVFCHEAAHAVVAKARGHHVRELALTLWGGHTSYTANSDKAADGAIIAVVGPLANLTLAVGFWFGFQSTTGATLPALLLYAAAFSNVFVGVFNLLPGLPLDGGQILAAAVWGATGSRTKGTLAAGWVGRVVAAGVLAWALLWPLARGRQIDMTNAIWALLIGSFLWQGATATIRNARRLQAMEGISVNHLAQRVVIVANGVSIAQAAAALAADPGAAVVVESQSAADGTALDHVPVGWVDPRALAGVPVAAHATTPIDAVMIPFPPGCAVDVSLTGVALLNHLAVTSQGARVVPITERGVVVGLLDIAEVAALIKKQ